jgi:predicted SAM-dependent methyltransferase
MDPLAIAAAKSAGLDAHVGDIRLLEGEQELFDIITMNHVVEHVHDPLSLLRTCHKLLKVGGILWLESPNFNGYGRKLFGRHWRGLEVPRHLVLFNAANLSELLLHVGFTHLRHADWMPQLRSMYQASKNIQSSLPESEKNLRPYDQLKIAFVEQALKKDILSRECVTLSCRRRS